jgi:PAS domain S-box-containing protein
MLTLKATKDVVFEHNPVTDEIKYSDSLFDMFGYYPHEIMTGEIAGERIMHPDDRIELKQLMEWYTQTKVNMFSYPDFRMLHKDGSTIFVEVQSFIVRNEQGTPLRLYGSIRNVTERHSIQEQLRKSIELFELASKASYDIFWDADMVKRTIYLSEAAETKLGLKAPLTLPISAFEALRHPDDVPVLNEAIESFAGGQQQNGSLPDHRIRRADGSYAYVRAKMHGVRNAHGNLVRMVGVITDITHEKIYQLNLERLNQELERQKKELTKSNADLERFAYVASHDLQEPLRMISSFMSLLKKRYNDLLDETGRQYIYFAVDGADRMKQLILNLLQFSRIGNNKAENTSFESSALVESLLQEFMLLIREKNAEIIIGSLPPIVANQAQMIHVFRNIISNALKYSTNNPVVEIGGSETEAEWQFFVKDNGIGIDPRYFDKIFILFQQLHSKTRFGGTGIGLSIAKKIIENHSGKIWIESNPGEGSTFFFTIAKA